MCLGMLSTLSKYTNMIVTLIYMRRNKTIYLEPGYLKYNVDVMLPSITGFNDSNLAVK